MLSSPSSFSIYAVFFIIATLSLSTQQSVLYGVTFNNYILHAYVIQVRISMHIADDLCLHEMYIYFETLSCLVLIYIKLR